MYSFLKCVHVTALKKMWVCLSLLTHSMAAQEEESRCLCQAVLVKSSPYVSLSAGLEFTISQPRPAEINNRHAPQPWPPLSFSRLTALDMFLSFNCASLLLLGYSKGTSPFFFIRCL